MCLSNEPAVSAAWRLMYCAIVGQKIAITAQLYQTPQMYAWVLYTSLVALALVRGADYFERWAMRWT